MNKPTHILAAILDYFFIVLAWMIVAAVALFLFIHLQLNEHVTVYFSDKWLSW